MAGFSITGRFLTKHIRYLWESKQFKKAVKLGLESLQGANISHIIEIIDGKSKLEGINDLDLVDDGEFKPYVSFIDILDYSMIPNNGYFRIYDADVKEAEKIIEYFTHTPPDTYDEKTREFLIYKWEQLLPEVKNDFKNQIPHWMSVDLRKSSDNFHVRKKANFYSINLVESELVNHIKEDLNRKKFDSICNKFHIYSDREEAWEQCIQNRKMVNEPTQKNLNENIVAEYKQYKHDNRMKYDYGWLSPDGRFTVCDWAAHETLASVICRYFKYPYTKEQEIGKQLSDVLIKMRYVKIHRDDTGFLHFTHDKQLTPEQEMKIDRYKHVHKIN